MSRRGTSSRTRRDARRERNPVETRRAIVEAATELFRDRGFDRTSVGSIVERAGVTTGSFYHHFEGKESLLRELHETFIGYHLRRAHEILDSGLPPAKLLRAFITDVLIEGALRYKLEIAIFYEERRRLAASEFREIKRKRDEFEECLVEVLRRGMDQGVFHQADARLLAFAIIGMCAWSYHWIEPHSDGRMVGNLFADLVLSGLLVEPEEAR